MHTKEHVDDCANVTHMNKVYNSLLNYFGWPIAYIGLHWTAWVKPTLVRTSNKSWVTNPVIINQ